MFAFFKKKNTGRDAELDAVIEQIRVNAGNNYKDAAQKNLREFKEAFAAKKASGLLSEKQLSFYEEKLQFFETDMNKFTHADQKCTW